MIRRRKSIVHYPYHKTELNGMTCSKSRGGFVTCHIEGVTCGRCKQIMAKRGVYGDFIFHLAIPANRYQLTFSR